MLNKLFERGANVIYGKLATVHVSGHWQPRRDGGHDAGGQPKYLIPVHGETRHLHLHARLAEAAGGWPRRNVFILNNGAVWATDGRRRGWRHPLPRRMCWWMAAWSGEVGELVMRDRQRLSQDGFIVALIPVNARNKLAGEPEIISRGFVPSKRGRRSAAIRLQGNHTAYPARQGLWPREHPRSAAEFLLQRNPVPPSRTIQHHQSLGLGFGFPERRSGFRPKPALLQ